MKTKKNYWSVLTILVMLLTINLTSCSSSDDDGDDSLKDQTIYVGDSIRFSNRANVANKFVAYVSNNGYLHGFHVGQTTVSNGSSTAQIIVKGRYSALDKVQVDWTLSPDQLKSKQGGTVYQDITGSSGMRVISYQNVGVANRLLYGFVNNKLVASSVYSNPKDMESITNYLRERYVFSREDVDDYTIAGLNALNANNATTFVTISLNSNYKTDYMLQIGFASTSYLNSSKSSKAYIENMLKTTSIGIQNHN